MSIYTLEQDGDAEELRRMLRESASPAVRERAAEALGGVSDEGSDAAVDALVQAAITDDDPAVRATAVDAIDGVGGDAIDRLFVRLCDVDLDRSGGVPATALAAMMDHDTPEVRIAAATAIGNGAINDAVPALLSGLTDPDPRIRVRVAEAAGRVGDPRAIDPISSLAAVAPPSFRRTVARSLGEIGSEAALTALEPLLDDGDPTVREEAVTALGALETCRPVDRLVDQLTDESPEIRQAAARGIVDLLSNAPPEVSHELRTTVVSALSTAHDGAVVEALLELFERSTEARRRRNAAWLLGRVSETEDAVVGTLVAALDDEDETVRQFAATSLVAMDDPRIEDTLLEALGTTFGAGRGMVIFVLGKLGSERARQRLLRLLDEVDDDQVQGLTLAALSCLGGTLKDVTGRQLEVTDT